MTILEALAQQSIRYARGVHFTADSLRPGYFLHIATLAELDALLAREAEGYEGSAFVPFDAELPARIPQDQPDHTWATLLRLGTPMVSIGAVVVWSSAAREVAWRAQRPTPLSPDDFHLHRSRGADEQDTGRA